MTALSLGGQVLAVRQFLDAILQLGKGSGASLWLWGLVLCGLTAATAILSTTQGFLQRLLGEQVARSMWGRVLDVATTVDLRHFESPQFFNALQRVQTSALTRPYQVTQGLLSMLGSTLASVGVGVALASINPLLLPLLILGGLPMLVTSRRESRLEFDFSVEQSDNQRLRSYLSTVQTGRVEAKEIRAFDLAGWLRSRFDSVYDNYLTALSRHLRRRTLWSALGSIGGSVMLVLTLVLLVRMIIAGRVSVAGAGAALVAIRMIFSQVQTLFSGVQRIFESGLFIDDLTQFLRLGGFQRADDRPPAPPAFDEITAENISYSYPGSEEMALQGVDLRVGAGEIVAVVGENGSGKTTLAKILAGLYDPDQGRVCWDGTDVRSWSARSVRARTAVIFQDFVRYALTAQDNIALGDVDPATGSGRVRAAAAATGIDGTLAALPHGYRTVLSRLFADGSDLSGGQWQRVAIARGYYRDAPLVVLDEPSASLDPRAEADLFASLRRTLAGRTAVFISHRFSTLRAADRIYVLHEGRVVEHGSHQELMLADGRYAELFRLQADAYLATQESYPAEPAR
jgi:ATP-binding cassette subfamily B protein